MSFVVSILALTACMACTTPSRVQSMQGTYGFIRIGNVTMPTISGKATSVKYSATFVRDTVSSGNVDGGTLRVAGTIVPQFTLGTTVQYRSGSRDVTDTDGKQVVVSVGGNAAMGIPEFTGSVYVPKAFLITSPAFDSIAHDWIGDRSEGLELVWNADSSIDIVEVRLDYMGLSGSGAVGDSIGRYWWIRTDDDGSYTIPSSVLSTFTSNTRLISVTLQRKNDHVVTASGKKFLLRGDAYTTLLVKLID